MPYTLLAGEFVIRYPDLPRQGPQPDGDTVKFAPDTPALIDALPRPSGGEPDLNERGISVRLEAIDALETHFNGAHQELDGANAARDALLGALGFTGVTYFTDLPNTVESAGQDRVRGHVLSNGIDANGRMIGFVEPGDASEPDGTQVFLDDARARGTVNAALLADGLVYAALYSTLPASLREEFAQTARQARAAGLGLWPRATADPDGPATIAGREVLEALVLWPKLFRRLIPYLAEDATTFDGFDAWLREDPVNRDDGISIGGRRARLHDVVKASGDQVQLTAWPEDFVITPDPP